MARLKISLVHIFLMFSCLLNSLDSRATDDAYPPDLPEDETINAYKSYWQSFEQYEAALVKDGRDKFAESWENLKKSYRKQKLQLNQEQLEILKKSAQKYRQQLEEHPSANNRPFVLLNLAQVNFLIANKQTELDSDSGSFLKDEAISYLKEIDENFRGFVYREKAQYLRAIILKSTNRPDEALAVWESLVSSKRNVAPVYYAHIAIGDHYFSRDMPGQAAKAYKRAVDLLEKLDIEDIAFERIRASYRLAWAAYRSTDLDTAVNASLVLLQPNPNFKDTDEHKKIVQDAINLIADALYEANSRSLTKSFLKRSDTASFAPKIGLRILSRYSNNNIANEVTHLGEILITDFPLAKEAPDIILITADAFGKVGQEPRRTAFLEKLVIMLPSRGLWRSHHKDDPAVIREMEEKARQAAVLVGSWHYERGLASGSITAFAAAAANYEMLIENGPNSDEANQYRLRLAHCYFFSGNNDEAANLYESLKSEYKVDSEILQIASYQLVLTNERRWRETFAKVAEKGGEPQQDAQTQSSIRKLEKSVDEFAARFPGQSRAVDLLLVAANANRDMGDYDHASNYWQRVLVSQPSPPQRAVAVRGLVFSTLKTQSPGQVVELTRRFLKLEDWQTLGLNIGTELKGVLAAATLDESKRLNDSGKILEAGTLLSNIASDFPDIPGRDRIWRDGGYLLAIAGDWSAAQATAEAYLDTNLNKSRADMVYLAARANEYQIRLHEAAKRYFELGNKFPDHSRAKTSLGRAESLALAENDYALAAAAALEVAKREKDQKASQDAYLRAASFFEQSGNIKAALDIAQRRLSASKNQTDRFKANVMLNRLLYVSGREQESLDNLLVLSRRVEREKSNLKAEDYGEIAGEIHFLLGEEARQRFDDFRISERSGNLNDNVNQKSRYFEELVAAYDKSAAAGSPIWAAQARYKLAAEAESFAEEIASIPNRTNEPLSFKSQSRYKATVDRLKNLARRYYSSNVLASRRDTARYKDNEWIKKSIMRLNNETSESPDIKHREQIPVALPDTMTLQWSLK